MLMLALALAIQAPSAQPAVATGNDTIIVTATRDALRRALERCEQGGCIPREDVVASIRYAEVLFRAGDYLEARKTLQKAIVRDKHAAPDDPIAVAALYEATSNVALHEGDQDIVRRSSATRVAVLRDNLVGANDRVLMAAIENGDTMLANRRVDEADSRYRAVARRAQELDLPVIYAAAKIRKAVLAHADRREHDATRMLGELLADERQNASTKLAVRAMLARFARERGDKGATDALVASYISEGATTAAPMLLWQPPLDRPTDPSGIGRYEIVDSATQGLTAGHTGWADIAFTIKPDGTVSDPEVIRGSRMGDWTRPVLKMIGGRRYTPLKSALPDQYHIERWSLTLDYATPTGSLIRMPSRNPHFVQTDLTPTVPNAAP